jgi:magnesium-transporting ATPase (P-type)
MGIYITVLSILWFVTPFFRQFFDTDEQFKTGYFAFFIFTSIFNGFNVRTDKLSIFKDLDKNTNFMKVWLSMFLATVVLCMISIIPGFKFIGEMFNTAYFGIKGWLVVVLYSVTIIPVDMLRKIIFKTYKKD